MLRGGTREDREPAKPEHNITGPNVRPIMGSLLAIYFGRPICQVGPTSLHTVGELWLWTNEYMHACTKKLFVYTALYQSKRLFVPFPSKQLYTMNTHACTYIHYLFLGCIRIHIYIHVRGDRQHTGVWKMEDQPSVQLHKHHIEEKILSTFILIILYLHWSLDS